jgi:hypothetical protein
MVDDGHGGKTPQVVGMAMVASAALVNRDQVRFAMGRTKPWQNEVWGLFDEIPELRSGIDYAANACSRARLYVGVIDPDGSNDPTPINVPAVGPDGEPITPSAPGSDPDNGADIEDGKLGETGAGGETGKKTPPAPPPDPAKLAEALAKARLLLSPLRELTGGWSGQSKFLKRLAYHLNVPGESFVVGFDHPQTGERRWQVCSNQEVSFGGGDQLRIKLPETPGRDVSVPIGRSTTIRMWREHPNIAQDADSPVHALRGPLTELVNLSAHIIASAESRLAGAGILFVPEELAIPSPQQSDDGPNPLHSDTFTASLIEAMAAPLKNRDSASAIVPLVVRGPAAAGDKMKHISFATKFDERVEEMRDQAVKRVAIGLDLPPEVLTGMGKINHWGQWGIEEAAIKLHIEPLLGLICDALTVQFYQPVLRAMGVQDWHRYAIWYDTADLSLRANRGPEATEAFQNGAIGEAAYRREVGFSEEDAPTDKERAAALARQIALTNANLAPILLPRLGIHLSAAEQEQANPQGTPAPMGAVPNTAKIGRPAAPAPVGGGAAGNRNEIPARQTTPPALQASAGPTDDDLDPWLIPCLDMAVRRALSRAGQYLIRSVPRSQRASLQQMDLYAVHCHIAADPGEFDQMLTGAYADFHTSIPSEPCLHRAVDSYVRALLTAGEEHRVEYLHRAVAQFGCA